MTLDWDAALDRHYAESEAPYGRCRVCEEPLDWDEKDSGIACERCKAEWEEAQ